MTTDAHKNWELSETEKELEFARNSLSEELGAINNYAARIAETKNKDLKKILLHNMNEEKEHVAMLVEWIRKADKEQNKVFEKHH